MCKQDDKQVLDWRCVVRRYVRNDKLIKHHPYFARQPLWLRTYLLEFQRGLYESKRNRFGG